MKKIVFVLVIILAVGGLVAFVVKTQWSGEISKLCKTNPSLLRFGVVNNLCANANKELTLKCSYETHTCENVIPQKGSGNYKITIIVDGKPGKGIEVDLGVNAGPKGDQYIKTTDAKGVAIFEGVPPGTYNQGMNLAVFPKEYRDAYKSWTWAKVIVTEGKTIEMEMNLHTTP